MNAPDLVIPVRLSRDQAVADLHDLANAGRATGAAIAGSMKQAQDATDSAGTAAAGLGAGIGAIGAAAAGVSLVTTAVGAMEERMSETARHTQQVAQDFIKMRQTMQEIAVLSGQPNNNQFTIDQAMDARSANLTPDEWKDFQGRFLNYAGSQVSQGETLGAGQKLTASQGRDYAKRVAEFFKASGINPAEGADLAGAMLTKAQGPQDVDRLMQRLGTTFQLTERGQIPMAMAVRALPEIMAKDVSAEDAAEGLSVAAGAVGNSRAKVTYQRAIDAVRRLRQTGQGKEFGLVKGQNDLDSLKAFGEAMGARRQKLIAGGMTEDEADDELGQMMREQKIAPNIQEARGLLDFATIQGTRLGGFRTFDAIRAATPDGFIRDRIAGYRSSDAGKHAYRMADAEVARLESGIKKAPLQELLMEAETQLEREGRLDQATGGDAVRELLKGKNGVGVEGQLINERARANLMKRFGYDENAPAREREAALNRMNGGDFIISGHESQAAVNEGLLKMLGRLVQLEEEKKQRAIGVGAGVAALVSPPAPRGR